MSLPEHDETILCLHDCRFCFLFDCFFLFFSCFQRRLLTFNLKFSLIILSLLLQNGFIGNGLIGKEYHAGGSLPYPVYNQGGIRNLNFQNQGYSPSTSNAYNAVGQNTSVAPNAAHMYPANSTVPAGLSSTNVSAYASATTADGIESILNHKFFQPSAMPPPPPPPNQSNGSIIFSIIFCFYISN